MEIGTRRDASELISSITGIETIILRSQFSPSSESVAKTMSWASKRNTTRLEDMAYCLMGLFDVNMPLLYGEGSKAFYRLQLEIIKSSTDQSIFAWGSPDPDPNIGGPWTLPLFATEPAMFQHAGTIDYDRRVVDSLSPYTMTNKGLQIQAKLVPARGFTKDTKLEKLLLLNCHREIGPSKIGLAIFLEGGTNHDTFARCSKQLFEIDKKRYPSFVKEIPKKETQIYIKNNSIYIDSGKNESNVTLPPSVLLDLRSALKAGFAITKKQYIKGRLDQITSGHSGTWEGDSQIITFPDFRSRLQVDCIKLNEMFRITISTTLRLLGPSIEIYQKTSGEGQYLKLPSKSHLPSGKVVRTVLKKRMVKGEPMWAVEVLVDIAK